MARARNIKPGFFMNDELAELSCEARLLFIGLWTIADREGRLEDRPKKIKSQICPYDKWDVEKLLDDLCNAKFITRYSVDGLKCIHINTFRKHQNPHQNEKESELPPPPSDKQGRCTEHSGANTKAVPELSGSTMKAIGLIPDSLIPDSGFLIPDPLKPKSDTQAETRKVSEQSKQPDWQQPEGEQPPEANPSKLGDVLASFPDSLDTDEFSRAWHSEWIPYQRQLDTRGRAPPLQTQQAQLAELARLGSESAIVALRTSIRHGWKGVFPDKVSNTKGKSDGKRRATIITE